jgi:hypothetical protein
VVSTIADYARLRDGGYVVKQSDLPFYEITVKSGPDHEDLDLKRLDAGQVTEQYPLVITAIQLW